MKKLALIILLALSFSSYGQSDTSKQNVNSYFYGSKFSRLYSWNQLLPPQDTVFTKWGVAQKGSTLYVGNGTYWSGGLFAGGSVPNGSQFTIGTGTGISQSNYTFRINDSLVNPPGTTWGVLSIQPEVAYTTAPYGGNFIGVQANTRIGALNTQDWTGTVEHANFNAFLGTLWTEDGATGTISSATVYLANMLNNSAGLTVSNAYLFRGRQGANAGTITNMVGLSLEEVWNGSTSNTYILTGSETAEGGNWTFYDKSNYDWYTGTGTIYVGDTTDNGTGAKFQVSGSISASTGLLSGYLLSTGSAPTVTPQAGAGTGATASIITSRGNSLAGLIQLTVGTSPSASGTSTLISVAFASALPSAPKAIILYKAGTGSGSDLGFTGMYTDVVNATANGFDIKFSGNLSGYVGNTLYIQYLVIL